MILLRENLSCEPSYQPILGIYFMEEKNRNGIYGKSIWIIYMFWALLILCYLFARFLCFFCSRNLRIFSLIIIIRCDCLSLILYSSRYYSSFEGLKIHTNPDLFTNSMNIDISNHIIIHSSIVN